MECIKCRAVIADDAVYCAYCGKKQVSTRAAKPLKRANGNGSVYKLSGRRRRPWVAALRKNVICYAATRAEALDALEAVVGKGMSQHFNDTLSDVYDRWKYAHFRNLTEKGREGYLTAWERLAPIKNKRMREIKTIDFQQIVDTAMTRAKKPEDVKPLSRSGKEKIKQIASQLCKQAMQDEIINRNYGAFIKLDKEQKKEKPVFTDKEIAILFAHDDNRTAQIILVLIYSGMRINELFQMRRENVFLEEKYMIGGEKTDAGRDRIIPISDNIFRYVENWYQQNGTYLLQTSTGTPINLQNFRKREYYPLLDALGITRKNPHCTRHTFSTMMVKAGARPEYLQKILGHANYSTTADVYVHTDTANLVREISILNCKNC